MSVINYISEHPAIAFVVGSCHIAFAKWIVTAEIPHLVMQILQGGAWLTTITVGAITIYGFFKKIKNDSKGE